MNNKVFSMLGLAQKAGKLVSGDYTCELLIKSNKCDLVIIANDASDKSKKKFIDMCNFRNVKIFEYGSKDLLGECIGKENRAIIGIKDKNFASSIEKIIEEKINGGEPIA